MALIDRVAVEEIEVKETELEVLLFFKVSTKIIQKKKRSSQRKKELLSLLKTSVMLQIIVNDH